MTHVAGFRAVARLSCVALAMYTLLNTALADSHHTRSEEELAEQVETAVQRDLLQIYKAPGVTTGDSGYPIYETTQIPFAQSSNTPELGARTSLSLIPGQTITGTVITKYRDDERASLGIEFTTDDGHRAVLHFDYNETGGLDSGLVVSNGAHLGYMIRQAEPGRYRIISMERDSLIPQEPSIGPQGAAPATSTALSPTKAAADGKP